MPTDVAAEAMSVTAASAVMPMIDRMTPNRAVTMGRPPATRDPKVSTRMTSATARPTSSGLAASAACG